MRSPSNSTSRTAQVAALLAAFLVLLAGCGGSAFDSSGDTAVAEGAARSDAVERGALDADGATADKSAPDQGSPGKGANGVNRTTIQTRAVIRTGLISLTSPELDRARQEASVLIDRFGGFIAEEETSHNNKGTVTSSRLVIRVRASDFDEAMEAFSDLGKVKVAEQSSEDVTTEVIDVEARVRAQELSLNRLEGFLQQSADLRDVIALESEIAQRQQEVDSLKARLAYLEDQTSLSTITLHMSTPDSVTPSEPEEAGFLAGLMGGWKALKVVLVAASTMLGAVIPFGVALTLVGVPLWLLARGVFHRRVTLRDAAPAADGPTD